MDVGGQALCTFHLIGAWAVAGVGALYTPARKASSPTTMVRAMANWMGTSLRISGPSRRWGWSEPGRKLARV